MRRSSGVLRSTHLWPQYFSFFVHMTLRGGSWGLKARPTRLHIWLQHHLYSLFDLISGSLYQCSWCNLSEREQCWQ